MTQQKPIETQLKDSIINPGDTVRLLQPFRPQHYCVQQYAFAIVVGVIKGGSTRSKNYQVLWDSIPAPLEHQPRMDELVVHLYEPQSSTIYADQFGTKALFSFDGDEVELLETSDKKFT